VRPVHRGRSQDLRNRQTPDDGGQKRRLIRDAAAHGKAASAL
jgi:hypothetical protein